MATIIEAKSGDKYGRLTIIKEVEKRIGVGRTFRRVLAKCDCGIENEYDFYAVRSGNTISCGCSLKEVIKRPNYKLIKHNLTNHRIYKIWGQMKKRCNCKTSNSYKWYGERGIKVCDEWNNDFLSFYNWAISNGYKDNLTIERLNVNSNYCPENCSWILLEEQAKNKTTSKYIIIDGVKTSIRDASNITGIKYATLKSRAKNNNYNTSILSYTYNTDRFKKVTIDGIEMLLTDAARINKIDPKALRSRIEKGVPIKEAILKNIDIKYRKLVIVENYIMQYDLFGNFIAEHINSVQASKNTGVYSRSILAVANKDEYKPGKVRKQAGGFIWKLKKDCNETSNTK